MLGVLGEGTGIGLGLRGIMIVMRATAQTRHRSPIAVLASWRRFAGQGAVGGSGGVGALAEL